MCCSNGKSQLEERLASSKQNILAKKQDTYSDFIDERRYVGKCTCGVLFSFTVTFQHYNAYMQGRFILQRDLVL